MVLPVDEFMRLRLRQAPRRFGEDEEPDMLNQVPGRLTRRPGRWPLRRWKPERARSSPLKKDDDAQS